MRSAEQTINDMGALSNLDRVCIDEGWISGNFSNAYETDDYDQAVLGINGTNGFYRVGFLLGFFASYENHEVSAGMEQEVDHYRKVMIKIGVDI